MPPQRARRAALTALAAVFAVAAAGCGNEVRSATVGDAGDATSAEDAAGGDATVTPDAGRDTGPDASDDDPCIPWDDACPDGQYCQLVDEELTCIPDGDVRPDPGASNPPCPDGVCSRGGICMPNRDAFGGDLICYQPCNVGLNAPDERPGNADCFNGRHTCWPVEGPDGSTRAFGLCAY